MKAFISQPMKGKTTEQIKAERSAVVADLEKRGHTVLDSVFDKVPSDCNEAAWCLGRSIQLMSNADFAVFMPGWIDARGCRIEHEVCKQYGIPKEYVQ